MKKRTNWNQVFNSIINPQNIWYFFFVTVFLSMITDTVNKIIYLVFEDDRFLDLIIVLIIGIFGFLVAGLISLRRIKELQKNSSSSDLGKASPTPHKGLILLVSKEIPARKAIEHHWESLEKCWLICSKQTLDLAKNVQAYFPEVCEEPIVINDVFDPIESYNCVKEIYKRKLPNGWTVNDVIIDFTGLTALASVGSVLASSEFQVSLQYTPAESINDQLTGKSLPPIEIFLTEEK